MKTKVKKILKFCWRAMVCLLAIGFAFTAILLGVAYYMHVNDSYVSEQLSKHIQVRKFYNRSEYGIYNDSLDKFVLKEVQWVAEAPKKDSLTVFCKKGKRGYLNVNTGEIVIEAQYSRAWIFSEGVAAVMKNGKIGFINRANEMVIPFQYDYADRDGMAIDYLFRSGYCVMTDKRGACGMIDPVGNWVVDAKYDCIWTPHKGKYRIVKDGDEYGLLDEHLSFIFPIEYDYIEYAAEGGVFLRKDGYKWHADYDGTVLRPFLCDGTDYLSYSKGYNEEGACVDVMSPYMTYSLYPFYGIIRKDNGKVIVPAIYSHIRMLSDTMFEAQLAEDDEWVLIDVTGKVLGNK